MIISACRFVDEVLEYNSEEQLYDIMKSRNIDIRFLGDDYIGRNITGDDLDVKIHYIDRSHGISTTSVLERILKTFEDRDEA